MTSPKRTAEDIIREREAAQERALEAKMKQNREKLEEYITEFTFLFATTTQAALNRLERNGFPGGELIKFPDEEEELAAWELPRGKLHYDSRKYYLASDGDIREYHPFAYRPSYKWTTISTQSVRREALEHLDFFKSIESGLLVIHHAEYLLERCNLICPSKLIVYSDQQPPWWKRIFT